MTIRTPDPTAPARTRSRPLVILDLSVGIFIALFGLVVSWGIILTALSLPGNYIGGNTSLASTISTVWVAVAIFGWALSSGMFIVRAIQRRYAFFWPIIGIIIVVLSFYIGAFILGSAGAAK